MWQRLGERFLDTGALVPLSSLLYFEMSREAIGQTEGVAFDIRPQHIYAGSQYFDPSRHGKPLVSFPEWPSREESAPVEEVRAALPTKIPDAENPEAEAAVRLLRSLGYLIVPPRGRKQ